MTDRHPRPPLVARWLLLLWPLGDRRADIEADLEELFQDRAARHGLPHARQRFVRDVLSIWRRVPVRQRSLTRVERVRKPSRWLAGVAGDAKYAFRVFRRQAGVVAIALAGLALSIAMTTVVFAITNAFNFRPLGVSDPTAVVKINRTVGNARTLLDGWSYADYLRLHEAARLVTVEASVRAVPSVSATPAGEGGQEVDVRFVTGTFARTFGGRTLVGRAIEPGDDVPGAPAVAVLHHAFWRARLASDPSVVGRALYFNGVPVTVVGIFDARSTGPFEVSLAPSIQLPLATAPAVISDAFDGTGSSVVTVTGLLARSATIPQAEAELSSIVAGLGSVLESAAAPMTAGVTVRPRGNRFTADDLALLSVFMTIVGLVLLLAATNVANLLLAGATTRRQEIGARLALGASRGRIVRQLTTESVLLGLASGVAGLALAVWLTPLVARAIELPPAVDLSLDMRVCLFAAGVSLFVGIAAGLAPARFGARGDLAATLKGGNSQAGAAPTAGRLRSSFLAGQAAASVMLLVMTALFTRVLVQVAGMPLGVDPDRLVVLSAFGPRTGTAVPADQFWDIALARIRALPGVESVSLVERGPFASGFQALGVTLDGQRYPVIQSKSSSEYFETAGFRLLAGRTFSADEMRANAPVALITSKLARDFWPAGDALGSTLARVKEPFKDVRIIGIVTDATPRIWPPNFSGAAMVFRPLDNLEIARMMIRAAEGSPPPLQAIRDAVGAIDPTRRPRLALVSEGIQEEMHGPRMFATGGAIVGGLALILAVIGVFGVTAFVVNQRRREIGIRMAIGAEPGDVVRAVFNEGMRPIAVGLLVGLGLAFFGTQVLGSALAGVSSRDPISFGAAAAVLLLAAGLGVLIPARRAARLDPAAVLKEQ